MSVLLDAAAAKTAAEQSQRHRMPFLTLWCCYATLPHSVHPRCKRSHDWSVSRVVLGWKIGRWYCLHGTSYTTVKTIQLIFNRNTILSGGTVMCGLYTYAGYMRKNTVSHENPCRNPTKENVVLLKNNTYTKYTASVTILNTMLYRIKCIFS